MIIMAAVDITAAAENTRPSKLHELIEVPTPVVIDGTDGGCITFAQVTTDGVITSEAKSDDRVLLYIINDEADANTVTLAGSDGWGDMGDLTLSLAASTSYLLQIESARFVQTSGTYKGMLQIKTSDAENVRIAAIVLH